MSDRWSLPGLARRVQNLIVRGTVLRIDDARKMQELTLELEDGHEPSEVEQWHPYGVSYHPHPGAEVLAVAVGGNRDHLAVVGTADRRHRMKDMAAGEFAIHDDQKQALHFKRGKTALTSPKLIEIASGNIVHINP